MKNITLYIILAVLLICVGCKNSKTPDKPVRSVGTSTSIEGDSTLYGLACDGCTDSVLVFLPGKGGDPVTYNIIQAMKKGKVIGRPHCGDWVAVILNGENKQKADMVINLDNLKGTWVQKVMPVERERVEIEGMEIDSAMQARIDAMMKKLMVPVEQGFALKRHYMASPVGFRGSQNMDEESPVVYPTPKYYTEWHVINGKLVLTVGKRNMSAKNQDINNVEVIGYDTAEFVMMTPDSLRLRFADGVHGYRRK